VNEWDPYAGILAGPIDGPAKARTIWPEHEAPPGLRVEHRASGFRGAVVRWESGAVVVRGSTGLERTFRPAPGAFGVDGRDVTLVPPRPVARGPGRTASGSTAVAGAPAQVAKASRIWVEGVHDAALVERVWGDDLRVEGVVVEPLDGIDHLADAVRAFQPGPARRVGVLVDHLVAGSKERRIVDTIRDANVLVTGHPYVDIWQAVKPTALGIDAWPTVPRGTNWKDGICVALGVADLRDMWRRVLASVDSYADVEVPLLRAVEELIDFVTS
jgi:hypothetical protein